MATIEEVKETNDKINSLHEDVLKIQKYMNKSSKLLALVDEQVEDKHLWLSPQTATEDYQSKALKCLHDRINEALREG
jgi:hypothetical protein